MSFRIPARVRIALALLLLTIGFAPAASAATATFRILMDLDNNPATGCDVQTLTPGSPFKGVEQILITTVTTTGTTAQVTDVQVETCTAPPSGFTPTPLPPLVKPLPWPVGTNGVLNPSVIETYFPLSLSAVANPLVVRLGVLGFDNSGTLTDEMLTTEPGSGFPILLQVASIAQVPTLSEWGLILLGLVLAFSAMAVLRRRRTAGAVLLALLLLGAAGVAWAAAGSCDLDGTTTGEWSSDNLLATEPTQDAPTGADIRALYGFKDAGPNALCFRIDALLVFDTAPVAVNDSYTMVQDTTLNVPAPGVLGNDQGGNLTATPQTAAFTAQLGIVNLAADGSFSYTPAAGFVGTDSFTYTVNNAIGPPANGTVTITVTDVNHPPSFTKGPDQTVLEDSGSQVVPNWATAISPGPPAESGQTVTFLVTNNTNPALFSFAPAVSSTGTLTYMPAPNANGTATITLVAMDDGGTADGGVDTSAPQTFVINVTAVNDAPSFTKGADQTVLENAGPQTVNPWATAISAGPPDESGQTLVFNVTGNTNAVLFSAGPAISPTGVLTYTPTTNQFGTATITIDLMDNGGTANGGVDTSAPQTFVITVTNVNQAPSFTKGPDQTVLEDAGPQTVNGWATAISAGPNEGGQTVTFQVTGNTNAALFSAAPAVSPTGVLTYTPAANANGTATITIDLMDNGGTANGGVDTSAPQTFVINVTAVNDAPSFTKGPDQTVLENAGPQTVPWATAISPGPPDESSQTVTFNVTNNTNPGLFSAGPAISPTGVLTYTPATNTFGTATITIVLMDNGGTANGGVDTSAPQTFVINVANVNQAPSFTKGADQTVLEDAGPQTVNPWATAISAGPGEGTQTVNFQVTGNTNPTMFSAGPAVSPTGVLTYTPAANANGTATITLVLMDNGGTANGGVDTSAPQTFVINVTAVNDAPSFTKGADQTVLENAGPQTVNPWATAVSPGPPDESSQALTFQVTGNTNAALFSAGPSVSPTGVLTFTPATNQFGTATITIDLKDNGGTANGGVDTSAPQTFVINVTNVNQAPSFTKGADQTVLEDAGPQTVNPWATAISAGPNEGTQTVNFQVTGNTNPAMFSAGPAVSPTGVLTYTPAANANGTATITIVLHDNGGTANGGVDTSAPQTFVINVTAVNDAPSFTKGPDQTVLENAGAQTVNGWATAISPGPADEAGQTVAFMVTGNTNAGLFSAAPAVSPTGVLTYTPATNTAGTATITIVLKDNGGTANGGVDTSAPQTFVINVTAVNQAPSFTKGPDKTVLENSGAQTFNPWATAISPGPPNEAGQTVVFNVTGNTNPSLFSAGPAVSPTGVLTFTPAAGNFGSATVTLVIMDNGGTANGGVDTSAPQTFTITVTQVNQAPSFTKGPDVTVLEDAGPQTISPWATAISAGPPSESGQTLVFNITGNTNPGLFAAGPSVSPTGVLTFTPAANANGTATITLNLMDNGGTANGGQDTSATQTFVINVTSVNDAPSFTAGPNESVFDNAGPQTFNPWATAISAGPANESGQTLTFNITGDNNPGIFAAGPSISPTGVLTFTPAIVPAGTSTATIMVQLMDNGGTANGGVDTSATQTFTIMITHVNIPPSLATNPVTYTTPGNTQLHVAGAMLPGVAAWTDASGLLAKSGATDPDNGPGSLSVVPASGTTGNGGSYSIAADGSFTYVPAAGFTGADSFTYQVTDTQTPTTGTINITVGQRVWYIRDVVDANNPAGGDGRSTNAFDSIAAFNAATTNAGDIIFVFEGNTGTTPLSGSITLKDSQKLWGQGIALNVPGFGTPLVAATNKAHIQSTAASTPAVSVPATAGNRNFVEVRGLDLQATGATSNAVDVTATGANMVSVTISDNNVSGATGKGVNLSEGSTASYTATLNNNAIAATGNAFDASTLAGAGTLTISFSNNAVVSNATGININGAAGGTTWITNFANNAVSQNNVGTGIAITSAKFDAVPGGAYDQVSGGTTILGISGNGVGGAGMVLGSVSGDLAFTNLQIFADGGAGLRVTGTGAVNVGAGTGTRVTVGAGVGIFEAIGGPAADVTNATIDLQLASLKSTNSATTGVSLDTVAGTFSAGSGSTITNATGTDFNVNAGTAAITYNGTITDTTGRLVSVTSATGGTISFTGAISDTGSGTGQGIFLNANTGATISFSAPLTLSTGANAAFTATGGGTVTSTDTTSTVVTTTGTAINVANTTIGAAGLKFKSVSAGTAASGPASGIILNNTGASGGLTVSGTGAAGSGGTIQKTGGSGISLTSVGGSASLTDMNISNTAGDGITAATVKNFSCTLCNITNPGSSANKDGLRLTELSGTASLTNVTVTGATTDGCFIQNSSATLTSLTVTGGSFGSTNNAFASADSGLIVIAKSTGVITAATVSGTTFANNFSTGLQSFAQDTATIGDISVSGCTFTNNGAAAADFDAGTGSPNMKFHFLNNLNINGNVGPVVNVFSSSTGTGGLIQGRIDGNHIGTAGTAGSGSTGGDGIRVFLQGVAGNITIVNNVIRETACSRGIDVETLGPAPANGATRVSDIVITGNDVNNQSTLCAFPADDIYLASDNQAGTATTLRAEVHTNKIKAAGASPANTDYPFDGNTWLYYNIANTPSTAQLVDFSGPHANANAAIAATQTSGTAGALISGPSVALIAGPITTVP